jgi:hypothetical protein
MRTGRALLLQCCRLWTLVCLESGAVRLKTVRCWHMVNSEFLFLFKETVYCTARASDSCIDTQPRDSDTAHRGTARHSESSSRDSAHRPSFALIIDPVKYWRKVYQHDIPVARPQCGASCPAARWRLRGLSRRQCGLPCFCTVDTSQADVGVVEEESIWISRRPESAPDAETRPNPAAALIGSVISTASGVHAGWAPPDTFAGPIGFGLVRCR